MPEAVSLFSGSLSSSIATEQVIRHGRLDQVIILTLRSPFFDHYDQIKELATRLWPHTQFRSKSLKKETKRIGAFNEKEFDRGSSYCRRCRATLLEAGGNFLEQVGADFLVSGEVADERGGVDIVGRLAKIDRRAGVRGLVFRPLASGNAPDSLPERQGWVSHRIEGVERKEKNLEIILDEWKLGKRDDFFNAEERCKLTNSRYRCRLKDLMREESFNVNDLSLLDFDDYYKIPPDIKVVLGKGSKEKRKLHNYFLPKDLRVYLPTCNAPMALVRSHWKNKSSGDLTKAVRLAARVTAAKSGIDQNESIPAKYRFERDNETYRIDVRPLNKDKLEDLRL